MLVIELSAAAVTVAAGRQRLSDGRAVTDRGFRLERRAGVGGTGQRPGRIVGRAHHDQGYSCFGSKFNGFSARKSPNRSVQNVLVLRLKISCTLEPGI
jgi:hypothetical protein